jgi:hypothetical protein
VFLAVVNAEVKMREGVGRSLGGDGKELGF